MIPRDEPRTSLCSASCLLMESGQNRWREKNLMHSQLSCSANTTACASATKTVRSALPMRSLPSKLRTMYFASWPRHDARSLVMMETFLFCDWVES